MILTLLLVLAIVVVLALVFWFGLRLGSGREQSELAQLRWSTVRAKRQMHDLTRQAFVAIADEAQRQRSAGNGEIRSQR
jgi:hypothetical protein